jgi:hypothetical protein
VIAYVGFISFFSQSIKYTITMSNSHKQGDNNQSEDLSHPGERGRQLGHENAHGGQCVGTGGHGTTGGAGT